MKGFLGLWKRKEQEIGEDGAEPGKEEEPGDEPECRYSFQEGWICQ